MLIPVRLTDGLRSWLEQAHDDGSPALVVTDPIAVTEAPLAGHYTQILRADGSQPSATEQIEIRALVAAHRAEPLEVCT